MFEYSGLSPAQLSFLKRLLYNSLPHLEKPDQEIAYQMLSSLEEKQRRDATKLMEEIRDVTRDLSVNQRQFVTDALMQGFPPIFDPYPMITVGHGQTFNTPATHKREPHPKGARLICPE